MGGTAGLPVKSGTEFRCRDCGGSIEGCPQCGSWLDTRMGRYGRFLGCSNYPDCNYTPNLRQSGTKRKGCPARLEAKIGKAGGRHEFREGPVGLAEVTGARNDVRSLWRTPELGARC